MANSNQTQTQSGPIAKGSQVDAVMKRASELTEDAGRMSNDALEKSIEVAKKYPLHTAVGVGIVGFIAGVVSNKILKH